MKSFSQTCDKPYDRHNYKVIYNNSQCVVVESYEECQLLWFQTPHQFLSHIEVLDKKNGKGFK